jgi:hypothetical protein
MCLGSGGVVLSFRPGRAKSRPPVVAHCRLGWPGLRPAMTAQYDFSPYVTPPPLAETGEGEGGGIDDGRVAGDQIRGEAAGAGTDAEAMAGKA